MSWHLNNLCFYTGSASISEVSSSLNNDNGHNNNSTGQSSVQIPAIVQALESMMVTNAKFVTHNCMGLRYMYEVCLLCVYSISSCTAKLSFCVVPS